VWDDGTIWLGARDGRLSLRACADCARICHPPLPMCPHCQSLRWEQQAAAGKATLISWLVSLHPGDAAASHSTVIVVRLDEGVNFVSNLSGASVDALYEGMALDLCFENAGDLTLPVFRPAGGTA